MSNGTRTSPDKLLKMGLCVFCSFVRGHEGETPHAMRIGSEREGSQHNNIYNNNIYISELEGCCVAAWGFV